MSGLPSISTVGGLATIQPPLAGVGNTKDRLPNTPLITNVRE